MAAEAFFEARGVTKSYGGRTVVQDAALRLDQGGALALVGESGAGKSTLARCLAGWETADSGEVRLNGTTPRRGEIQLIPQQPAFSLNPHFSVEEAIGEPLRIQRRGTPAERGKLVRHWMEVVGLPDGLASTRTSALSGGEGQRVAIARALIVEPKLLILDESLSGLDLSVRAQIGTLLLKLRREQGLTYILITHDPDLAAQLADQTVSIAAINPEPSASRPKRAFLARRLLHAALLLMLISFFSFLLSQMAPGDFYSDLRGDPRVSTAAIEGMRARAGIDRPLLVRYGTWVASSLRGDFGYSLAYQSPVSDLLWERTRATLLLTGLATLLAWLIALPLGIWNASRRGTWPDGASSVVMALLLAVPDLLLALLLLTAAAQTGWFAVGGAHLAIPLIVLVAGLTPMLARHVRASMLETMNAPFALSARAQGIPRRRLLYFHLLPAAVNPLVSLFGLSISTLLSASLLVEVVTGWPGLGPLFLNAITTRDFAIVLAVVVLSAMFLLAGNLLADVLLYRLDPRIRTVDQ